MSGVNQSAFMNLRSFTPPGPAYELYAWGYNGYFAYLGTNNTTSYSSPVQVGALTDWAKVDAGNFTLATKTDGTLWSWGLNSDGQLGLGISGFGAQRSSPVQVGALTNWAKVSASLVSFSLAVKTDGTLWSWGRNDEGQLGHGNTTNRSSPVQVGALTNWDKVSVGSSQMLAIKTDGTLWSWGAGGSGRLGLGDTTGRFSPVQVGSETNWLEIASGGATGFGITET